MRIKLDENLPSDLVGRLESLGHSVDTVRSEGLQGTDDAPLWERVQTEKRFLIMQDLDFSDARRFRPGTHAGILIVRLTAPSRRALFEHIWRAFSTEESGTWEGCFVVVTERKVRVRRPSSSA